MRIVTCYVISYACMAMRSNVDIQTKRRKTEHQLIRSQEKTHIVFAKNL